MDQTPTTFLCQSPLPSSPLYQLIQTPAAGRGVFATANIPPGTLILSTATAIPTLTAGSSPETSPLAWLIQRPYRKEACAHCFAYNRGREWKLKAGGRDCGVVFCSEPCRNAWLMRNEGVGMQAWELLETNVKSVLKRNANANGNQRDVEMYDVGNAEETNRNGGAPTARGPSAEDIDAAWEQARRTRQVIVSARTKANPSKAEKRVLRNAAEDGGDPDLMYYLLTAVITAYNALREWTSATSASAPSSSSPSTTTMPSDSPATATATATSTTMSMSSIDNIIPTSDHPPPTTNFLLHPLFQLTPTLSAYQAAHTSLPLYTRSYLHLQTFLPLPLTQFLTPNLAHNLNIRAAHNAFSIRPTGTTDGSDSGEFLGWAVYPSASFFNHSCRPNLDKVRTGRVWEFFVTTKTTRRLRVHVDIGGGGGSDGVKAGEELCISYLGGEEEVLDVVERRKRLKDEWGFVCRCERCTEEADIEAEAEAEAEALEL